MKKSGPTQFTRGFVKTCLEYKINRISTMRDYDILTDHEKGMSIRQLAIKHSMSVQGVFNIIHKLK